MKLRLYNSLNGKKEDFHPIDSDHVRVYACGPTVYSYAHIGNARMAVVFDLLVRILRTQYSKVTYVSNITDVDDKIMAAAKESGEAIETITTRYARIYNEDMAALGVLPPDVQPTATSHIPEMIALNEKLIARDHAYEAKGHVLFNVPSFPAYGKLSGRSRDDQIAGARVEVSPFKKDPADFVLWKPSDADQVGWDSPWGRGRPGWHIECSAMAEKHLGLPFDIHGGGADLKFPHHENEIAQSCCAHGHENEPDSFSRYWVHNGFVTVEGEKMSKSLGNTLLAHDLIKDQPGEVLRLALLSAHYRQPLDWTEHGVQQARKNLDTMYRALYSAFSISDVESEEHSTIVASLADDLNTPGAIAAMLDIAKALQDERRSHIERGQLKAMLKKAGYLMGLLQQDPKEWLGYGIVSSSADEAAICVLIQDRNEAKAVKNFALADEIRKSLADKGILIEDTPNGTVWKRA